MKYRINNNDEINDLKENGVEKKNVDLFYKR